MSDLNPRKRPIEEEAADLPGEAAPPNAPGASPASLPSPESGRGPSRGRGADGKAYKGLRHFAMMVCRAVEERGTTTYNEVADRLVERVLRDRQQGNGRGGDDGEHTGSGGGKYDEKNIRRRVYDALNVLMAMDIITKDKKAISWKGLPSSASQDLDMLHRELEFRRREVVRKREALREVLQQQICFRNLVERNQQNEQEDSKIPLPFIVVNTDCSAVIQCNMSRDRTNVMLDFSLPFEINDDNRILKCLGLDKTSLAVVSQMLPGDMLKYCQDHHLIDDMIEDTAASARSKVDVAASCDVGAL